MGAGVACQTAPDYIRSLFSSALLPLIHVHACTRAGAKSYKYEHLKEGAQYDITPRPSWGTGSVPSRLSNVEGENRSRIKVAEQEMGSAVVVLAAEEESVSSSEVEEVGTGYWACGRRVPGMALRPHLCLCLHVLCIGGYQYRCGFRCTTRHW